MSDVVLRQKVGIPAGIDERVVDAGGNGNADRHFFPIEMAKSRFSRIE